MDQHFKLERACEEIQWLNVEIPQVITYIRDEDACLRKEAEIRLYDTGLAHQVFVYRGECGQFNAQHMACFWKLAHMSRFTGSIQPGISMEFAGEGAVELRAGNGMDRSMDDSSMEMGGFHPFNVGDNNEGNNDSDEEALAAQLYHVLQISAD